MSKETTDSQSKDSIHKNEESVAANVESDAFSWEDKNGAREKFSHVQEKTSYLLLEVSDSHEEVNSMELSNKITEELEKLIEEFTETDNCVQDVLDALWEEICSQHSKRSWQSRFTIRSPVSGHSQRGNKS